jgi:ubiquitin carboxyl-terminal hydrolase 22/27/51
MRFAQLVTYDASFLVWKAASLERWRIPAPIGMFNLGNTCSLSSVLQCLINCIPLQRYFLKDIGHHHSACEKYRHGEPRDKSKATTEDVCLACEMDALMLEYYGRSTGRDVVGMLAGLSMRPRRPVMELLNEISEVNEEIMASKGEPLIISRMLLAAWKCGGMDHLRGYQQVCAGKSRSGRWVVSFPSLSCVFASSAMPMN